jgi:large subunit ribosomal protein L14e
VDWFLAQLACQSHKFYFGSLFKFIIFVLFSHPALISYLQALIDHPDETRRVINFKRLLMTDFKIDIPRCAKKSVLKKAVEESDVFNKFAASGWGKKIAKREAKAAQTDLDRYKSTVAKIKRSAVVRRTVNMLKKAAK